MPRDQDTRNSTQIRFGEFEADLEEQELRKGGNRLRLPGQSFRILAMLLLRPGELVTREKLREALWPADTFVDFEHGLNTAVNRLREALCDSADNPKFIETLPRRGYKFIAPVEEPVSKDSRNPAPIKPLPDADATAENEVQVQSRRPLWAVLATLPLVVALMVLWFRRPQVTTGQHYENLRIVPLTSYPGAELYPSFSPDGNEIAFAWNGGESGVGFDVYRKQIGSERAVRLTSNPAQVLAPAWSPDGRFIAFARETAVYMTPSLGGPERKLADASVALVVFPWISWSPDGKTLAFPGSDAHRSWSVLPAAQIHLLDVDTMERRILPSPDPGCKTVVSPSFSPSGDRLAVFCARTIGIGAIYVQSSKGEASRELVKIEGDFEGLAWASDGKSVLYSLGEALWRVSASGGSPEKLFVGRNLQMPAVAAKGNKLAYSQQTGWGQNLEIWRLSLDAAGNVTGPAAKIISSSQGQQSPRISPNGKRIAFESGRSGSPEIWAADSDGTNLAQLTSFGGPITGTPRWSPDSRHIVFDSHIGGHPELYVVSVDGGPPHRTATGTVSASEPSFSWDGRWIYFDASDEQSGVWKVPAAGGTAIQLTHNHADLPQESVDGARVFYVDDGARLMSVSATGDDEREMKAVDVSGDSDNWTPARNGVYFIDGRTIPISLKLLNLRTGRLRKIADLPGQLRYWGSSPSVSADGRTLTFAVNSQMTGDIMLVEGFR
jgi:Tol biopolymer transport system component/DNA-binding winged helix-turn-helix (wHTH) protein